MDEVFKALGDPTRRALLDRLRQRNGQTLGELCAGLGMARQSATQHLDVLERANLVATVRRGRSKLHYLNPVPLHEVQERWIDKFDAPRLRALGDIRRAAEATMSDQPDYVYVTYIEATPERVWDALTDADLTAAYWGHRNESDWQPGSVWHHVRTDGSGVADVEGRVVEADRPHRLVTTWADPDQPDAAASTVTFAIEASGGIVRLTVTHEGLDDDARAEVGEGWPAVLSNLKSVLETGHVLPMAPWEMA
jgi:uncharacterized protein YndB with AHSA1/START domain/DNA-binding transcriptional ArsR family regulator